MSPDSWNISWTNEWEACPFLFAEYETKTRHPEADSSGRKCKMWFLFIPFVCSRSHSLHCSLLSFSETISHLYFIRQTTLKSVCSSMNAGTPSWQLTHKFYVTVSFCLHAFLLSWATPLIWRRSLRGQTVILAVISGSSAAMPPCIESVTTSARSRWGRSLSS